MHRELFWAYFLTASFYSALLRLLGGIFPFYITFEGRYLVFLAILLKTLKFSVRFIGICWANVYCTVVGNSLPDILGICPFTFSSPLAWPSDFSLYRINPPAAPRLILS